MKKWTKYFVLFLWLVLLSYIDDLFKIQKNIYYSLLVLFVGLGGVTLIFNLFEKSYKKNN